MKIAVISDIHGNLLALEAVLEDLKHESPDLIVNLGDCVSGPLWPEETAAILRQTDWPTVRGNHDRFLIEDPVEKMGPTDAFAAERLSAASMDWLKTTRATIRLSDDVFLCHGTPDDDNRYLTEKDRRSQGPSPGRRNAACGHQVRNPHRSSAAVTPTFPRVIHLSATGQTILNPGSVGLPSYEDDHPHRHKMEVGSPHARYAVMTKVGQGLEFSGTNPQL